MSWGLSRTLAGVGDSLPVEVQVISLGPELAIVCLSGEVFVDLGLAIKRASPFRTTLVVELCNCVETVYVPTRVAHAGGSYEATNSTVKPARGNAGRDGGPAAPRGGERRSTCAAVEMRHPARPTFEFEAPGPLS